jgi:hypothetical protein
MSNKKIIIKNILTISGLALLLSEMATAAVPNTPGPYMGVYQVTDTTARISFLDNSTNEDGFKVYIHDANNVFDPTIVPNPILVPKNDSGVPYQYTNIIDLTPNSIYKLKITAYNADGESAPTLASSINNGRIKTSPPVCQPLMPGEYVGTYNITNSSARISFLDNSDNEDGFTVYVYNKNTNALVKTITVPALSGTGGFQYANITGLIPNTSYRVAVTAFSSGCGESAPTHSSSSTNGRFKTTNETCPLMPGGYVGTYNVTSTSARISFLDNSDNESGFKVYVYEKATNTLVNTLTLPAVTGVGGFQYANITGLTANTRYAIRVSAFNNSCESVKTTSSSTTNGRFLTQP